MSWGIRGAMAGGLQVERSRVQGAMAKGLRVDNPGGSKTQ
jgi:hypothetical protein